jgi:hypothetical protein
MANEYIVMSDDELKKKYQYLSEDTGIDSVADWALPNSSEETDEDAVGISMAKEDISGFVGTMVGLFKKINISS